MKKIILITILFSQITISAQNWSFKSGGNAFDGKYKTSSIKGKGTDFPYNNPLLVINLFKEESLNFYIADAGYFQDLSETDVLWIFNNEPETLYKSNDLSKSDDSKILFFEDFINSTTNESLSKIEFIEKLKTANRVSVRIKDNYGKNDISFSLRGSTKAIDYVISKKFRENLIAYQKEIKKIAKERLDEQVKVNTRILLMLNNSGINHNEWQNLFEKIDYNCDLYDINLKEIDTININIEKYSTNLNLINKEGKILKEIRYIDSVIPEYIKQVKEQKLKIKEQKLKAKSDNIKPLLKHLQLNEKEEINVIDRIIEISERDEMKLSELDSINILISPKYSSLTSLHLIDKQKKVNKNTIYISSYRKRKLEVFKKNGEIRLDSLLTKYNLSKDEKVFIMKKIPEDDFQQIEMDKVNVLDFEFLSYVAYIKFYNNEKKVGAVSIFDKNLIKKRKKERKKRKKNHN